jgi:DNA-binding response OmpR family regulator
MDDFFIYPQVQRRDELNHEIDSLARFRRALRKEDQDVLDDLLDRSQIHFSLASTTEHLTSFEFLLLSMLLEQRKEIERLQRLVEEISSGIK